MDLPFADAADISLEYKGMPAGDTEENRRLALKELDDDAFKEEEGAC